METIGYNISWEMLDELIDGYITGELECGEVDTIEELFNYKFTSTKDLPTDYIRHGFNQICCFDDITAIYDTTMEFLDYNYAYMGSEGYANDIIFFLTRYFFRAILEVIDGAIVQITNNATGNIGYTVTEVIYNTTGMVVMISQGSNQ